MQDWGEQGSERTKEQGGRGGMEESCVCARERERERGMGGGIKRMHMNVRSGEAECECGSNTHDGVET